MASDRRVRWSMSAEQNVTDVIDNIITHVSIADGVFSKLGGVMGTVLAGISVAGLLATTKSIIDAGEEALKASQKIGINVEALQALDYAAKISNLSTETLQKGLKGLSTQALAAADAGSQAETMFSRLGVEVLDSNGKMKGTDQLLLDLATRFQAMPDGINKTAAATKIFGKAGLELIPFLNQGRDGIEALMQEAQKLGIVMDEKTAVAADALNSNITRLTSSTRGMMLQAIAPLIPFLTQMSDEMVKAKTSGDGINRMSEAITTGLRLVGSVVLTVKASFEQFGNTLGAIAAATVASFSGEFKREQQIWKQVDSDNQGVRDRLGKDLDALWNGVAAGAAKATAGVKDLGEATAGTTKLMDQWIVLRDKLDSKDGGKAFEVDPSFAKDYQLLNDVLKAHIITLGQYNAELGKLMDRQPFMKTARADELKQIEEIGKAELSLSDAYMASRKAADDLIGTIARGNSDIAFEADQIGKTTLERDLATVSRAKEKDMMKAVTPEQRAVVEQLYAERVALVTNRDERQLTVDSERAFWGQVSGFVDGFAQSLTNGVGGAIDFLKKQFKSLLADMLAIFAKRWILSMLVSGSSAGSGVANAAGSALGGAGQSALTSGLGSYIGGAGTGLGGVFGTGALTGAGDFVGTGLAGMAGNVALAAGATDAFAATVAAAVPVIGWIVAIGAVLYSIFSKPGGGPKSGGSFNETFSSAGADLGTGGNRLFTPNDADPQLATAGQGIATAFFSTLKQLGGTVSGNVGFALAFDSDPHGTADNRTSATATINGRSIYNNLDQSIGRDSAAITPALQLEASRMLLSALQASDLPKDVADLLNSVTASTATQDQINTVLAAAQELKGVLDGLSMVSIKGLDLTSLKAFALQGETITQTFQRVVGAFQAFDNAFMTDAQKLQVAQTQVTNVFSTLGIAVPQSSEDFYNLVHSIDVSTQSGRDMVTMLLGVAPAFQTVEQAVSSAIATFNQIAGSLSPSFGRANDRSMLESAVQAWMNLNPANSQGWTIDSTIQNIGALISSGQIGSAQTYAMSIDPSGHALSVLNSMLQAYSTWQGAVTQGTSQTSSSLGNFSSAVSGATSAMETLAQSKDGIAQWLQGLMLDKSLSPLTPAQRLDFAHDTYVNNLMKAQGGDIGALSQYTSLANSYLTELLSYYGPNAQYQAGFAGVANQGAALAGLTVDARPVTAADSNRGFQSVVDAINKLNAGVNAQAAALATLAGSLQGASTKNSTQMAEAVRDGALTFS